RSIPVVPLASVTWGRNRLAQLDRGVYLFRVVPQVDGHAIELVSKPAGFEVRSLLQNVVGQAIGVIHPRRVQIARVADGSFELLRLPRARELAPNFAPLIWGAEHGGVHAARRIPDIEGTVDVAGHTPRATLRELT